MKSPNCRCNTQGSGMGKQQYEIQYDAGHEQMQGPAEVGCSQIFPGAAMFSASPFVQCVVSIH